MRFSWHDVLSNTKTANKRKIPMMKVILLKYLMPMDKPTEQRQ
jgi:hypothetical protein